MNHCWHDAKIKSETVVKGMPFWTKPVVEEMSYKICCHCGTSPSKTLLSPPENHGRFTPVNEWVVDHRNEECKGTI